jgi:hypothetical protein
MTRLILVAIALAVLGFNQGCVKAGGGKVALPSGVSVELRASGPSAMLFVDGDLAVDIRTSSFGRLVVVYAEGYEVFSIQFDKGERHPQRTFRIIPQEGGALVLSYGKDGEIEERTFVPNAIVPK